MSGDHTSRVGLDPCPSSKRQALAGFMAGLISTLWLTGALAEPQQAGITATQDPWYIGTANELSWNYSLGQIKAASAYQRGYTGAGQTVAVFDSGLDTGDNQFKGRIAGPGYDAVTGRVGATTDVQWHGTFVSGIIAADRDGIGMMGVSYDAKLLPVRIVNADGTISLSDSRLAAGIDYARLQGAKVFNNSWNSSTTITALSKAALNSYMPATLTAFRNAVNANVIVVFAAGNDGGAQPGFYAALPYYYPELKAGWLAAVATDSSGAIASYSNRCGVAAAWCLAAPGSNIISVYNRGYGSASGTSFAAPALSGAAAILKQEFPYLTNQQILQILFQSANKSGIYANSAIYGQGLLDLNRATQPIGTLTVSGAKSSAPTPLSATALSTSSAFGSSLAKSLSSQPLLVRDDFGRGYTVPATSVVTVTPSDFDALDILQTFGGADMKTVKVGASTYAYGASDMPGQAASATPVPGKFYIKTETPDGQALATGYNVSPSWAFGPYASGAIDHADLPMQSAAAIPYLEFAHRAGSVAYSRPAGRIGRATFGLFSGEELASPFAADAAPGADHEAPRATIFGSTVELAVPVSANATLGLDSGLIIERGTFLGTTSSGSATLGADSPTYFAGLTGNLGLGEGYALFGGAHFGLSQPANAPDSMIESVSSVVTESYNLGVTKARIFGASDRAGFVASEPLRVVSGTARLLVPSAVDENGNTLSALLNAPLAADGREIDLQTFYGTPLSQQSTLELGTILRLEPDNVRGATPDAVLMGRYGLRF